MDALEGGVGGCEGVADGLDSLRSCQAVRGVLVDMMTTIALAGEGEVAEMRLALAILMMGQSSAWKLMEDIMCGQCACLTYEGTCLTPCAWTIKTFFQAES